MFNIGGGEMIMLAVLALLVFGPESLPDIAKTVSRTLRAFRQASADLQNEVREALELDNQARKSAVAAAAAPEKDEVFEMAPREPKAPTAAQVQPVALPVEVEPDPSPTESTEVTVEQPAESQIASPINETPEVSSGDSSENAVASEESSEDDDGPGVPMAKHILPPRTGSEPAEVSA